MLKKKILCLALVAVTAIGALSVCFESNIDIAEAAVKYVNPGNLITNTNFKNGNAEPWKLNVVEPADADFDVKDGTYTVTINEIPDRKNYTRFYVALSHQNLKLQRQHKYYISFTVTADYDCSIYPKIGDRSDPYNEYWNGEGTIENGGKTWNTISLKAGETKTITGSFMMDKDVEDCEFAFHLSGDCAPKNIESGYSYTFSDIEVKDEKFPGTEINYKDTSYAVKTNQLGYSLGGSKEATAVLKDKEPVKWKLINSKGMEVLTGVTKYFGKDRASGDNIHKIDFSSYNISGDDYRIVLESGEVEDEYNFTVDEKINVLKESRKFKIGDNIYSQLKYDALKNFYFHRTGIKIEPEYTDGRDDLVRPASWQRDKLYTRKYQWYKESYALDITGGWCEGTDYVKSVVKSSIPVWTLQNLYENQLNRQGDMTAIPYGDNILNIMESGNGISDILDEARYNMEFMLKMQVPSNHRYEGMVHEDIYIENYSFPVIGSDRAYDRELNPPTTKATLNLAATAAQTARLWKDYDNNFSEKCLKAAKKAYDAAKKYDELFSENNKDKDLSDEFYWAACELYATTGDGDYLNDLKENKNYLAIPTVLKEDDGSEISGCYDTCNVQALGTLSLLSSKNSLKDSKSDILDKLKESITKAADDLIRNKESEGYGTTIKEGVFKDGEKGYQLNSNVYAARSIMILCYADMINKCKGDKYLDSAENVMGYLLGNNANSKSYITGYGDESVQDPYDKFYPNAKYKDAAKAPSGMLVSGPNSQVEDVCTKRFGFKKNSVPSAKCYIDNYDSWSTNSSTLEGNAALSWAAIYLDSNHKYIHNPLLDLNSDGIIDIKDYTLLKIYINKEEIDIDLYKADVNKDGDINILDLIILKNLI